MHEENRPHQVLGDRAGKVTSDRRSSRKGSIKEREMYELGFGEQVRTYSPERMLESGGPGGEIGLGLG